MIKSMKLTEAANAKKNSRVFWSGFLSVAYLTVANLAWLEISVHC